MSRSIIKPPLFTTNTPYVEWRMQFEAFIAVNEPDMQIYLENRYERPLRNGALPGEAQVKLFKSMTPEERKTYDTERKTYTAITMALSQPLMKEFQHHKFAYDLWQAIENRCGGSENYKQSKLEFMKKQYEMSDNQALLAHITSKPEVPIEEPSSCVSCIKLTNKVNRYSEDTERLNSDLEKLTQANEILKDNEKAFDKKLDAAFSDRKELKAKIFSQQDEIDSYINMIALLRKDLAEKQSQIDDLNRKLSNFSTSSLVFDEILQSQRTDTKSKAGLGYHYVPPPSDYLPMPSKDAAKDFVHTFSKVDTKSVAESVFDTTPAVKMPEFVKAKVVPPVNVEEIVEMEDLTKESEVKVEKVNVKPENYILTNELEQVLNNKGKNKVVNESESIKISKKDSKGKSSYNSQSSVSNLKKEKIINKSVNEQPSTSTCSTLKASTSTCTHKCSCSVNASTSKPPSVNPPSTRFEGSHWKRPYVERRSCFRCGQQGHIIRDCRLLSLDRCGRGMPRASLFRNSSQKSCSRRGSFSPVSSCASNSPTPLARVNKVVPSRPYVQNHNIVENKSSESNQFWKPKSTNDTSMKSTDFLKYHKLIDVMVMDESGQPKSIKAWVSHKY